MQDNIINNNNVIASKLNELVITSNQLRDNLKINTQQIITNLESIKNEYYNISSDYNKIIKEKTNLQKELTSCNNNKASIDNIKRNIAEYDEQIEHIKTNLNNIINEYSLAELEKNIMQKLNEIRTRPIDTDITINENTTNPFANIRNFFNQNRTQTQTQPQNQNQNQTQKLKGGKLIKTKKNYKKTKKNKKNRKKINKNK